MEKFDNIITEICYEDVEEALDSGYPAEEYDHD